MANEARRSLRTAAGRCPTCDAVLTDDHRRCYDCRSKMAAWRAKKRAQGGCSNCGKPRIDRKWKLCEVCRLYFRIRNKEKDALPPEPEPVAVVESLPCDLHISPTCKALQGMCKFWIKGKWVCCCWACAIMKTDRRFA